MKSERRSTTSLEIYSFRYAECQHHTRESEEDMSADDREHIVLLSIGSTLFESRIENIRQRLKKVQGVLSAYKVCAGSALKVRFDSTRTNAQAIIEALKTNSHVCWQALENSVGRCYDQLAEEEGFKGVHKNMKFSTI